MYVEAIRNTSWQGIYNATAPNPVRMGELCSALGRVSRGRGGLWGGTRVGVEPFLWVASQSRADSLRPQRQAGFQAHRILQPAASL